jgi:hypothetical protein
LKSNSPQKKKLLVPKNKWSFVNSHNFKINIAKKVLKFQ